MQAPCDFAKPAVSAIILSHNPRGGKSTFDRNSILWEFVPVADLPACAQDRLTAQDWSRANEKKPEGLGETLRASSDRRTNGLPASKAAHSRNADKTATRPDNGTAAWAMTILAQIASEVNN
jgi:hypothetical protein